MTTESQQYKSTESDEISLKDLLLKIRDWWRYLLSKWIIILSFGLLGGISGFAYAYFKKPIYTATTTFVLEDEKGSGGLGNLAGLASMAGVDLGGSGGGIFQGDNILQLYKSRSMLEKTLLSSIIIKGKNQLLIDRFIESNELKKKWAEKPKLLSLNFRADSIQDGFPILKTNRLRDSILGVIVLDLNKNYLVVTKPDKKLSTIQVDVKAKDELFAKAFNDELVKNVNEFYVNTKTKKTLQNVKILQLKTDSVRSVMNGAIYTAVAVADATPNLNPTRQVQRVAPVQKAQFSAETNKVILSEMAKNLEMTKMALLKETPLIQVIDQPIYPLEKKKLGYLKGIVLGGILAGILTVMYLSISSFLQNILKKDSR
ncbi:Wzz/FepE/Etk N-terminal domain-containing protein [Pedobacter punctiformis]|uniref:Wzz/FepE/Etk N-terminal domain-containing protein n=1 Tax=Pedobacter punctiformis TaxID=3004097 RepID=A0ABT4L4S7_9SPHI|nr:Wzz/FepE/Etk N-terminal domain-containing protein [Pedobacter sp. HCMS5-2]MCZ4242920.1 Wzz/FepE/Etk N-terminal domain-containing protein [Pedobacter sp. HCMS5-2]